MKKRIIIAVLFVLASHSKAKIVHTFNFTEKGELKEVFDSGIHPHYFSENQKSSLQLEDLNFSVSHKGRASCAIELESVVIDLLQNEKLSILTMYGAESFSDEEIVTFFKKHNLDDQKIESILKGDSWSLVPTDKSKVLALGGIGKTYQKDKPHRFIGSIRWKRQMRENISFTGVIKPPKGYEHISLAYASISKEKSESPSPIGAPSHRNEAQNKEKVSEELASNEEKSASFPWWIIGLVVLLVVTSWGQSLCQGSRKT